MCKNVVVLTILSVAAGCCYDCGKKIDYPSPPNELRRQVFVYPGRPPIMNFSQFTDTLHFFAEQVTVLYLIKPNGTYRLSHIRCLIDIQKNFYRYGVYVLLIDQRGEDKWNELTGMLRKNRANFPAVHFKKSDIHRLYSYLKGRGGRGYSLFLIDTKNNQVRDLRDLRCRSLQKKVKEAVE